MRTRLYTFLLAVPAFVLDASFASVMAQTPTERPTITVTDFDHGTVAAHIAGDKRTRKKLEKMGVRDGESFASALGTGAADLIVEKLLARGVYRVLERKQLAAIRQEQELAGDTAVTSAPRMRRAQYIVGGSVTRLGFQDKQFGGAAGSLVSGVYGLGARKNFTDVHLTARIIDTETGEIVASFTGEGRSEKGWGLIVFGAGDWGLGGAGGGTSNFRESAIGEATERAALSIVEQIVALRQAQTPN
jgi:curli biogenesis system outer membrane secretion channel CsgG